VGCIRPCPADTQVYPAEPDRPTSCNPREPVSALKKTSQRLFPEMPRRPRETGSQEGRKGQSRFGVSEEARVMFFLLDSTAKRSREARNVGRQTVRAAVDGTVCKHPETDRQARAAW
jgi:hypothetical protein